MLGDDTACALIGATVEDRRLSTTDATELARRAVVTFRELPRAVDQDLVDLRARLQDTLRDLGVEIVPWRDAIVTVRRGALQRQRQVVSARIHAVFDVARATVAEAVLFDLEDPMRTQVLTIARVDELLRAPEVSYLTKIRRAARCLLEHRSEVVIGVFADARSGVVINITLDHTEVDFSNEAIWRSWILSALIPKAVTPITPIALSRFVLGAAPSCSAIDELIDRVIQVSRTLASSDLFPPGERFNELAHDPVERALVAQLTDGRSGYSLGFIAAGSVEFRGQRIIDARRWEELSTVEALPPAEIRSDGRSWYVRCADRYIEVPLLHIASSSSGADKNNLTIDDVVLLTVDNGRLGLRCVGQAGAVHPSFDTYVMIGALYGATFGSILRDDASAPPDWAIIHVHGYPAPSWLERERFGLAGIDNIAVSCGTPQAGILNLRLAFELFRQPELLVGSLIEPGHGTNLIADVRALDEMLEALQADRPIKLGGGHLEALRQITA